MDTQSFIATTRADLDAIGKPTIRGLIFYICLYITNTCFQLLASDRLKR